MAQQLSAGLSSHSGVISLSPRSTLHTLPFTMGWGCWRLCLCHRLSVTCCAGWPAGGSKHTCHSNDQINLLQVSDQSARTWPLSTANSICSDLCVQPSNTHPQTHYWITPLQCPTCNQNSTGIHIRLPCHLSLFILSTVPPTLHTNNTINTCDACLGGSTKDLSIQLYLRPLYYNLTLLCSLALL